VVIKPAGEWIHAITSNADKKKDWKNEIMVCSNDNLWSDE
jgi:hypothetical protein